MRQLRRLGSAALQRQAWGGPIVPAFWWDGHPNFGDMLTPWLLPRYGIVPVYREPRRAQLIGVGSLLEFVDREFSGVLWGTGLMRDIAHPLPNVTALALRGPLTAERLGLAVEPAYGDPGILVARHVAPPPPDGRIAVVPHGHHRGHQRLTDLIDVADARVVNVHQGAVSAIREIAAARAVVTTSLHGLITADSYGIPAFWTTLNPPLTGGDFKFRDYEATVTPGRSRYVPFEDVDSLDSIAAEAWAADAGIVAALGDGLEAALAGFANELAAHSPVFPRGVGGALLGK
ncbi:polysaccharide pyruvyl transferase family protein [Microbacterium sp. H1-D42]|uniref:polysaccharide pyruvyl transferase family protein n=1 Tax=Microbacterium sp. H1-D42 TaxID=2925844 RepID=UPI001F537929|nr:polysaccharide pyruvyl transferase family protein [Microbacterium sp. H1-D42]UNK70150.1 polysaccharide pyruvyl transferase family protein [Microbacterium sp. H1-D42]